MQSNINQLFMNVWMRLNEQRAKDGFMDIFSMDRLAREDSVLFDIYENAIETCLGWKDDRAHSYALVLYRDMIFTIQAYMITTFIYDVDSVLKKALERTLIQRESMLRTSFS